MLIVGGFKLRGRMIQHLWRMSIALYIAARSFFGGQEDVFPKPVQGTIWLQIPELLILATLLFWLVTVLVSKRFGTRKAMRNVATVAD